MSLRPVDVGQVMSLRARARKGSVMTNDAGLRMGREALMWLKGRRRDLLDDLRALVEQETPSGDPELLRRAASWLADWLGGLGEVTVVASHEGGPHLMVDVGQVEPGRSALVLCHYDTVWPRGTIERRPFSVGVDAAEGPGVLDMKASIVLVRHALEFLLAENVDVPGGVRVFVSSDEELGNPTSDELIRELAGQAKHVLVMEPPLADGRLKTSRKGYASVRLRIGGRAAHAGISPDHGISASVEAARAALFADQLNAGSTTVNVGVIRSGHRANVVPPEAELLLDVRAANEADLEATLGALRAYRAKSSQARVEVAIMTRRPPMQRVPNMNRLVTSAQRVGAALGMTIREGYTGGVSEGNLAQAAGAPTIDGLGVVGVGPHQEDERICVSSLVERTALHAGMLLDLSRDDGQDDDGPMALRW